MASFLLRALPTPHRNPSTANSKEKEPLGTRTSVTSAMLRSALNFSQSSLSCCRAFCPSVAAWVPLLPFAMKIGSELYHPAHGGDERPRSGSYTRAVNGCFDPKCCEKKE